MSRLSIIDGFLVARRVFEGDLQQHPGCAIANWGIAMDFLGNSLGGPPSRENANAAWAALEKARENCVKTHRERGWIDAIRAYYRDHDKTDVETRRAPTTAQWSTWRSATLRTTSTGFLCADLAGVGLKH